MNLSTVMLSDILSRLALGPNQPNNLLNGQASKPKRDAKADKAKKAIGSARTRFVCAWSYIR